MKCNEFEFIVLGLARNQSLPAADQELAVAHAKSCTRCAGRLSAERFLIIGAQAVIADVANAQAPPRVEDELLAAFRVQASVRGSARILSLANKNDGWAYWKPAALAASIAILITALAVFWLYSTKLNQRQEQTALYAPVELPTPAVLPIPAEPAAVKRTQSRRPQAAPVLRQKANHTEVLTDFYSLTDVDDLDASEVTQVVRVELPASALSAAGIPVDSERSTTPVKAEVALGYDGLARAIRFIR